MNESKEALIEVPDCKFEAFKSKFSINFLFVLFFIGFFEFIYCNEVGLSEDIAFDLLQLSDKYCLSELTSLCDDYISEILTVNNVVYYATNAEKLKLTRLKNTTLKFIWKNLSEIEQREDYENI